MPATPNPLLAKLQHHVTGAIERGEGTAIVEIPAQHLIDSYLRDRAYCDEEITPACGHCGGDVEHYYYLPYAGTVEVTSVDDGKISFNVISDESRDGSTEPDPCGDWCCQSCGKQGGDDMLVVVESGVMIHAPALGTPNTGPQS